MPDAYSAAFRVLVVGGGSFNDPARLYAALDAADARRRIGYLLHTDAPGAAALAGEWARERQRPHEIVRPAAAAGLARAQQLLEHAQPDAVIAFPGGAPLAAVLRQAADAGLPVWRPFG